MSELELVKREVELPKELSEVLLFLKEVVADVKAKKEVTTIVAEAIEPLAKAMEGMDKLDDEWKQHRRESQDAVLLFASDLLDMLLK